MNIDIVHATSRFNSRGYLRSFFHSKQSALGAVRIESSHCKSRTFHAPTLQLTVCQIDHPHETITLNHADRLREWHMSRKQNNSKIRSNESHCIFLCARQVREKFCVAWKTVPTEKQCALVDWCSGNRVDTTRST